MQTKTPGTAQGLKKQAVAVAALASILVACVLLWLRWDPAPRDDPQVQQQAQQVTESLARPAQAEPPDSAPPVEERGSRRRAR